MAIGQQAADRRQLAALNLLLPAAGCPLLAVNEGGGLMLWIMASPEGAIQTTDKQRNKINVRIEEAIHGKDHPGNQ
jgi:hypothetical protein